MIQQSTMLGIFKLRAVTKNILVDYNVGRKRVFHHCKIFQISLQSFKHCIGLKFYIKTKFILLKINEEIYFI